MRVRVTRQLHGRIDGIHLDRFQVGSVYDVTVSLACYLLASRAVEPVLDDAPPLVLPPDKRMFGPLDEPRQQRGRKAKRIVAFPRAEAPERAKPRKRTREPRR